VWVSAFVVFAFLAYVSFLPLAVLVWSFDWLSWLGFAFLVDFFCLIGLALF
jgi:hypothetical protein